MDYDIVEFVLLIIGFLSLSVFFSVLLKKIRVPYTIGLVLVGITLGLLYHSFGVFSGLKSIYLTEDLILYIILPTLIYDASINIDARVLKRNIIPILLLAVFGLLISVTIISGLLSSFTAMALGGTLLFGTLISATDPVAVIALFDEVGAPRRLVTLVDGESLFNDATAIVLFTIILSVLSSGMEFSTGLLSSALLKFFVVLLGGLLVGFSIGLLGALVMRNQKDNLIVQVTVSLIMAYVSFIVADHFLHVSGVMSTLAAGITIKYLTDEVVNVENYHHVESFWKYFSFIANSFVFLVLGLTEAHTFYSGQFVDTTLIPMLWIVPIVSLARVVGIYTLIPLYNRFVSDRKISLSFQHILFWGGLRGAVPVALVFSIHESFPGREHIIHITFGYILFTLLVQGTTMKKLMNWLKVYPDGSFFDSHEGVVSTFDFPSHKLVALVTSRLVSAFENEHFLVTSHGSKDELAFFLRKGQKGIQIEAQEHHLKLTAEPGFVNYVRQMLSEVLIELKDSVENLQNVVNPDEIRKLVDPVNMQDEPQAFGLSKYLKKNMVKIHLESEDKNELIKELLEVAVASGAVVDEEGAYAALLEREKSMTTGIGGGLAIPHAKCDMVDKITLVIGLKPEGVDFDSIDKKPVKLFFLILSPKKEVGPHMQLLAALSRQVSTLGVLDKVANANSYEEVSKLLS